jgi:nucleoside 2-deoxyribosyltransferase
MSFSEEHKNTYEFAIKEACGSLAPYKIKCHRLDESVLPENIYNELYEKIWKADIIIADLSGLNPNVFYEVGYAYGINKQIILLTNKEKIPFNLRPFRYIAFNKNDLTDLKKKLISTLRECLNKNTFLPGQDENNLNPDAGENPFSLTGWNKWGGISVFADVNTMLLQGTITTAGYVCNKLSKDMAGKILALYIHNTDNSNFSMNRLLKMTVNSDDTLLKPKTNIPLISNEYISARDGKVEYEIPQNFDGKLGFVFYEAEFNLLKITAFYRDK